MIYEEEFREFLYELNYTKTSQEIINSWLKIAQKYPGIKIISNVSNETNLSCPEGLKIKSFDDKAFLRSYYSNDSLYFIDEKLFTDTIENKNIAFHVEYSIMIDTNLASYINKFVRRERLGENWETIIKVIDHLLYYRLDYNYLYYVFENFKLVLPVYKEYKNKYHDKNIFWESLDYKFRQNLISLNLFKSIDSEKYRENLKNNPTISEVEAELMSIDFIYKFYFGEHGAQYVSEIKRNFYIHYLILIKIIQIQFSKISSPNLKLLEFLRFMHNDLACILERESVVAYKYFKSRNDLKFFEKINKGAGNRDRRKLQIKLKNMAWDFMIPRFMETLLGEEWSEAFFIPYFLTFDQRLNYVLDLYPVKGTVFEVTSKKVTSIPGNNIIDSLHESFDKYQEYFTNEAVLDRKSRNVTLDKYKLLKLIKIEMKKLCAVLDS